MAKEAENRRKIAELRAAPYNPRRISEAASAALSESLKQFGDIGGIVWNRRTGNVVAGHQRLALLKAAGAKEYVVGPEGAHVEHPETKERFPVRIVDWTDEQERAANMAANNAAAAGEFTSGVEAILADLRSFDAQMVDSLALDSVLEQVGAEAPSAFREVDESIADGAPAPKRVVCPKCKHRFEV